MSPQISESKSWVPETSTSTLPPPSFKLPTEILSEIFMDIVFDHTDPETTIEEDVLCIYRRLYNLLGVCTFWRHAALDRGALWSVIPLIANPSEPTDGSPAFQRSLQRAKRSKHHLVANVSSSMLSNFSDIPPEYGSRLCTLIIGADSHFTLRSAIDTLTKNHALKTLAKLSFQAPNDFHASAGVPNDSEYMFSRRYLQTSFVPILEKLSVFRISGVNVYWDTMTFSNRLVQVHIENITLGMDQAIIPFLQALSSASELRDLKLNSIVTLYDPRVTHNQILCVTFPKLRSLSLRQLYLNTFDFMIPIIKAPSYGSTISLTPKMLMHHTLLRENDPGSDSTTVQDKISVVALRRLARLMTHAQADTVAIDEFHGARPTFAFNRILGAIPGLTTLKIDNHQFDRARCHDLGQISGDGKRLEVLHLTRISIDAVEDFKDMVTSLSPRDIVVGGVIINFDASGEATFQSIRENGDLVGWLEGNVPVVRLVDNHYHPQGDFQKIWRLW